MDRKDINLWSKFTFKTLGYRKNFNLISDNDNFITLYDGMISEIRLKERKPPRPVGEYRFSILNIELGLKFNVDFRKLIKEHTIENDYAELIDNEININKYKKIVLLHTFILNKDYRKRGTTEEFIEMLFRDFYSEDVAIIVFVKPFQNNTVDADYYFNTKEVAISETLNRRDTHNVPAIDYYSLRELNEKDDIELNEYKLFNVAQRCGFKRINESHLFIYSPEKTIVRMNEKHKLLHSLNNE